MVVSPSTLQILALDSLSSWAESVSLLFLLRTRTILSVISKLHVCGHKNSQFVPSLSCPPLGQRFEEDLLSLLVQLLPVSQPLPVSEPLELSPGVEMAEGRAGLLELMRLSCGIRPLCSGCAMAASFPFGAFCSFLEGPRAGSL